MHACMHGWTDSLIETDGPGNGWNYLPNHLPNYLVTLETILFSYIFKLLSHPPGVGHLITVIIGAGVLSLPKAFSLLGWIFGPILLIFFGVVSLWTSKMLTQVYEVDGKKNKTYKDAVFNILGTGHRNTLAAILYVKMYVYVYMMDIFTIIFISYVSLYDAAHTYTVHTCLYVLPVLPSFSLGL